MSTALPTLIPLPDGTVLKYYGDPNLIPEITDHATGLPVPLAPARPNQFPNGIQLPQTLDTTPDALSQRAGGVSLPSVASLSNAAQRLLFGIAIPDAIAIVAGLILLAGAIFGFSAVRETTINVAKKGAEAAAA